MRSSRRLCCGRTSSTTLDARSTRLRPLKKACRCARQKLGARNRATDGGGGGTGAFLFLVSDPRARPISVQAIRRAIRSLGTSLEAMGVSAEEAQAVLRAAAADTAEGSRPAGSRRPAGGASAGSQRSLGRGRSASGLDPSSLNVYAATAAAPGGRSLQRGSSLQLRSTGAASARNIGGAGADVTVVSPLVVAAAAERPSDGLSEAWADDDARELRP